MLRGICMLGVLRGMLDIARGVLGARMARGMLAVRCTQGYVRCTQGYVARCRYLGYARCSVYSVLYVL